MKQHKLRIKLPNGKVETVIEDPEEPRRGVALIAHPHPLHGGSLDNKVTWTLARAAVNQGWVAIRPNFRGVGASDGVFDQGQGESEDLLALATQLAPHYPDLPWALMGFSFGAYVQHRVAAQLASQLPVQRLIMVGPAVSMYPFAGTNVPTHIIHGVADELIPLEAVRDYASGHGIPLHEIEGAGHFFHSKLKPLQALVEGLCK